MARTRTAIHRRRGYASRCLTRARLEPPRPRPAVDRFLAFVERDDGPAGHWRWRGYKTKDGNGVFRLWSGPELAARVAMVMFQRDALRRGERLRRTCSVSGCVAPKHHVVERRYHWGRALKLTAALARRIRAAARRGMSQAEIARRYTGRVSARHVSRVVRGEYPRSVAA